VSVAGTNAGRHFEVNAPISMTFRIAQRMLDSPTRTSRLSEVSMDKHSRFTGGQITAMVIAVCAAAVLTPVGAMAATGPATNISDPVKPAYKARVTPAGSLAVSQRDPINGAQARVNASGQQLVSGNVVVTKQPAITGNVGVTSLPPVTGSVSLAGQPDVTTHAGIPGTPYTIYGGFGGGSGSLAAVPAGKTFVVESVSIRVYTSNQNGVEFFMAAQTGGSNALLYASPPRSYTDNYGNSFYDQTLQTHFYVDGGDAIAVQADSAAGMGGIQVSVSGYLI
jgi:hypothetical protein